MVKVIQSTSPGGSGTVEFLRIPTLVQKLLSFEVEPGIRRKTARTSIQHKYANSFSNIANYEYYFIVSHHWYVMIFLFLHIVCGMSIKSLFKLLTEISFKLFIKWFDWVLFLFVSIVSVKSLKHQSQEEKMS